MGFEQFHPAVNLIFFTAVLFGTLAFGHPVFSVLSFLCAYCYCVKRNGKKAALISLALLPAVAAFALYYASYTHFGVTVIRQNFIGNSLTVEALVYGLEVGLSAAAAILWLACLFSVFTSDKVVYLFGRVSPRLSLWLSILLRLLPRIKTRAFQINKGRAGIGRGAGNGNVLFGIRSAIKIFSALITDTVDMLCTLSTVMRSRGAALRSRTAFSIYRFDNRDRSFVVIMFFYVIINAMGMLLGQTDAVYDPEIIFPPITPLSFVLYASFAALCLLPLFAELAAEIAFRRSRKSRMRETAALR